MQFLDSWGVRGAGGFVADQISYVRLMFAIAGGLVLGSIVSWILWMLVTAGLISAFFSGLDLTFDEPPHSAVTSSVRYQDAMERRQAEHARQVQAIQLKRAKSPTGRRLWQACDEWSANYKSTSTETTRINAKFHCDRYSRYIETGHVSSVSAPLLETR